MRSRVREALTTAINERRTVILSYGGPNAGERICNPHVLYRSRHDLVCVDCYQIGWKTLKGRVQPAWRPFDTEDIFSLQLTDETFEPAPGYNPGNSRRYHVIIARI